MGLFPLAVAGTSPTADCCTPPRATPGAAMPAMAMAPNDDAEVIRNIVAVAEARRRLPRANPPQ
ncbi:MAG: hypothetical protein FJW31_01640 [Acidobacteria bacterium]|nr:hypothetical protein [Acidobacteriota bacterium]